MTSFHQLHQGDRVLVLPNAWDVITARVVEAAGAKAIATSSAAVAWANGFADGDHLPAGTLLSAAAEIRRAVRVPLTIDLEGGYAKEPEGIADLVASVVDLGVDGINLEDGGGAPDVLAAKIAVVRRVAGSRPFFVNARTDVYLRRLGGVEETLARARLYREAGADGLFVPGLSVPEEIAAVANECGLPLNVMLLPSLPGAATLYDLGVRRLSAGTAIVQATLGLVRRAAEELLATGQSARLYVDPLSYADGNALVGR
jgi:2-methylisocitrate lyase-like PEP mutase family enzyme